jgi:hypothetical protein
MVSVVFGGFCARTDAVIQKSYLGWVPIIYLLPIINMIISYMIWYVAYDHISLTYLEAPKTVTTAPTRKILHK